MSSQSTQRCACSTHASVTESDEPRSPYSYAIHCSLPSNLQHIEHRLQVSSQSTLRCACSVHASVAVSDEPRSPYSYDTHCSLLSARHHIEHRLQVSSQSTRRCACSAHTSVTVSDEPRSPYLYTILTAAYSVLDDTSSISYKWIVSRRSGAHPAHTLASR